MSSAPFLSEPFKLSDGISDIQNKESANSFISSLDSPFTFGIVPSKSLISDELKPFDGHDSKCSKKPSKSALASSLESPLSNKVPAQPAFFCQYPSKVTEDLASLNSSLDWMSSKLCNVDLQKGQNGLENSKVLAPDNSIPPNTSVMSRNVNSNIPQSDNPSGNCCQDSSPIKSGTSRLPDDRSQSPTADLLQFLPSVPKDLDSLANDNLCRSRDGSVASDAGIFSFRNTPDLPLFQCHRDSSFSSLSDIHVPASHETEHSETLALHGNAATDNLLSNSESSDDVRVEPEGNSRTFSDFGMNLVGTARSPNEKASTDAVHDDSEKLLPEACNDAVNVVEAVVEKRNPSTPTLPDAISDQAFNCAVDMRVNDSTATSAPLQIKFDNADIAQDSPSLTISPNREGLFSPPLSDSAKLPEHSATLCNEIMQSSSVPSMTSPALSGPRVYSKKEVEDAVREALCEYIQREKRENKYLYRLRHLALELETCVRQERVAEFSKIPQLLADLKEKLSNYDSSVQSIIGNMAKAACSKKYQSAYTLVCDAARELNETVNCCNIRLASIVTAHQGSIERLLCEIEPVQPTHTYKNLLEARFCLIDALNSAPAPDSLATFCARFPCALLPGLKLLPKELLSFLYQIASKSNYTSKDVAWLQAILSSCKQASFENYRRVALEVFNFAFFALRSKSLSGVVLAELVFLYNREARAIYAESNASPPPYQM